MEKINLEKTNNMEPDGQYKINFEEAELLLEQQKEKEKNEKLEIAKKYGIVDWRSIHNEEGEWHVGDMSLKTWIKLNSGNDNADIYNTERYLTEKKESKLKGKLKRLNEENIKRALDKDNLK